jgi:hypothetical protein
MLYKPPSPQDLERLKGELGLSASKMASLFGVSSGRQWRNYTGGEKPRDMNPHMLFFAMARLELSPDMIERILDRMRRVGATIDLNADSPAPDGEQQP